MDYLQYEILKNASFETVKRESFKPCYKWITFNTKKLSDVKVQGDCFKPCYKWITFNTGLCFKCNYK